jgi:hypothetical protein
MGRPPDLTRCLFRWNWVVLGRAIPRNGGLRARKDLGGVLRISARPSRTGPESEVALENDWQASPTGSVLHLESRNEE